MTGLGWSPKLHFDHSFILYYIIYDLNLQSLIESIFVIILTILCYITIKI
jgi:hypothetical protein